MVPLDDVIGRAGMVYWPLSRVGILRAPGSGAPALRVPAAGESHT